MKILKKWIKKLDDNMVKKSHECGCCGAECKPKDSKKKK